MDTVFIYETGIHPWDQLYPTNDGDYLTISLLNQDFQSVWTTWRLFASLLTSEWPVILTWYTTSFPQRTKTQEYLTLKHFRSNSAPKDVFKKNEENLVYSGIEHLNKDPKKIDPAKLKSYRRSLTLMLKQENLEDQLWQRLSHITDITTTEDFKIILAGSESITFRFYDAETHGVAQLICHSMHSSILVNAIDALQIKEVSRSMVYEYIHS